MSCQHGVQTRAAHLSDTVLERAAHLSDTSRTPVRAARDRPHALTHSGSMDFLPVTLLLLGMPPNYMLATPDWKGWVGLGGMAPPFKHCSAVGWTYGYPALRVSADLLDLEAAPSRFPTVGYGKRSDEFNQRAGGKIHKLHGGAECHCDEHRLAHVMLYFLQFGAFYALLFGANGDDG